MVIPAVAGVVAIIGLRKGDTNEKPDRASQEVIGDAQDAEKHA